MPPIAARFDAHRPGAWTGGNADAGTRTEGCHGGGGGGSGGWGGTGQPARDAFSTRIGAVVEVVDGGLVVVVAVAVAGGETGGVGGRAVPTLEDESSTPLVVRATAGRGWCPLVSRTTSPDTIKPTTAAAAALRTGTILTDYPSRRTGEPGWPGATVKAEG